MASATSPTTGCACYCTAASRGRLTGPQDCEAAPHAWWRRAPKASTILNNHRAKLFLSGLADLSALELGARLIGDQALVDRNRSMGSDGRHSTNESTSYRPLLPVEDLRRGSRGPTSGADRAAPWPQDRTDLQAPPTPPSARPEPGGGGARGVAGAGRRPAMTLDLHADGIPADQQDGERPTDPRPAWERIAYAWLEREVDHGQALDAATLARDVSVAPGLARDLVRVLRAERDRDPGLSELRARLVRDRITDAYLARELAGGQQLDPKDLAKEVGTTSTVARQWLHTLRAGQQSDRRLAGLRAEPVSHGHPTLEQLQALQVTYSGGGRPQPDQAPPVGQALEHIEQLYQTHEVASSRPLDPAEVAQQVGVSAHYVRGTLTALRGGTLPAPSASSSAGGCGRPDR